MPPGDTKMIGKPILRRTLCVVGGHIFVWADVNGARLMPPFTGPIQPSVLHCDCGLYSYAELIGD